MLLATLPSSLIATNFPASKAASGSSVNTGICRISALVFTNFSPALTSFKRLAPFKSKPGTEAIAPAIPAVPGKVTASTAILEAIRAASFIGSSNNLTAALLASSLRRINRIACKILSLFFATQPLF